MIHDKPHPLANRKVQLKPGFPTPFDGLIDGADFIIEDWYDRVTGQSWGEAEGNPAAIKYALRAGFSQGNIPMDNEVVYGKLGPLGHLIHISEIVEPDEEVDGSDDA